MTVMGINPSLGMVAGFSTTYLESLGQAPTVAGTFALPAGALVYLQISGSGLADSFGPFPINVTIHCT